MNQDIATRWVSELRSGKYRQTKHYLARSGGYCCLGVLCEIAVQENLATVREAGCGTQVYKGSEVDESGRNAELPESLREWAGLKDSVGQFPETLRSAGSANSLAAMNDMEGADFETIADFIEQNWEQL